MSHEVQITPERQMTRAAQGKKMYHKKYHIHFVGIGGIGMSGIAELLINLGYTVSGSDLTLSDITTRLEKLGGTIYRGHAGTNIQGADVVVTSSAVKSSNAEVMAAEQLAIPVIPRAVMLAELMRLKYSIAIAGAHCKTSTTSIVSTVLAEGGLDPTVVIGGKLKSIGSNALLGQGDYIVAEADESDGSFLKMSPAIAVVTNIDREHLDYYPDISAIKEAFLEFIQKVPFYGLGVLCLDNEHIQALIPEIKKRFVTYGMSSQADVQARNVRFEGLKSRFDIYFQGQELGEIYLSLPGHHSIANAMAGIAVGLELDIPFSVIKTALEKAEGVQRRLEIKGERNNIIVVDDYGHHPTEIKATLQALTDAWPDQRKVVVFQPHRYSRTQALFDDFTRSFYQTDVLLVLPIYSAGEQIIEGVHGHDLCDGIMAHGHKEVICTEGIDNAARYLQKNLRSGDILLTLGAGDVWKVGEAVLKNEALSTKR
jgi:UDP-N-acetylmuramate--alanine ligase